MYVCVSVSLCLVTMALFRPPSRESRTRVSTLFRTPTQARVKAFRFHILQLALVRQSCRCRGCMAVPVAEAAASLARKASSLGRYRAHVHKVNRLLVSTE